MDGMKVEMAALHAKVDSLMEMMSAFIGSAGKKRDVQGSPA